MFLSIIIPYYNCGAYIFSCLNSVSQALRSFDDDSIEVIVVDDFNSDLQVELLQSALIAVDDDKIRTIRPPRNLGLSDARNLGIEQAQGEYVFFLDADDYVNSDNLKEVVSILQSVKTDLIFFDSYTFKDEHSWQRMWQFSFQPRCIGEVDEPTIANYLKDTTFYVWRYMAKIDFFRTNKFHSGMVMEDLAISPNILRGAKTYWYEPIGVVNYRVRPNSIMTSWKPTKYTDMIVGASIAKKGVYESFSNPSEQLKKDIRKLGYRFFYWAVGDARKANKNAVREGLYKGIKDLYIKEFGEFDLSASYQELIELYGYDEAIKWILMYYYYDIYDQIVTPAGNFKYKAKRKKIWKNLVLSSKYVLPSALLAASLSNAYSITKATKAKNSLISKE